MSTTQATYRTGTYYGETETAPAHPNNGARRKKDTMQQNTAAAESAAKAARDEMVKAERPLLMAVEIAQYTLEDYAHRPDIAAVLNALATYQAAQTAREAAGTALIAALERELDR